VKLEGKTAIVTGARRGIGRAVFLASEESDYISGAAIVIDGGWLTS
jgi:NAD(P)-dependent dehydrogenase (short-subunit alcohol dehydrogenase family)